MAEAENRFKALIQPIKDIASNWDIDIAESLTEYLEELDSLRISIDGGKSNLNFAEAALLIQGSTAVYSKKVEYLHQLVLQSLEFITNKKTAGTTQSKVNKSNDPDEFMLLDADESFLLLDNFVEEGHNINLKTTDESVSNSRLSNSLSGIADTSKVSMSLMHSLLNDDQGSTGLKLSTSMVSSSGALLLCGNAPVAVPEAIDTDEVDPYMNQDQDYGDGGDLYDDGDNYAPQYDEPAAQATPPKHTIVKKNIVHKDLFSQLDPHSVVAGSRAVRRGKTYKIPAVLLSSPTSVSMVDYLYADAPADHTATLLRSGKVPSKGLFDLSLLSVLQMKRKHVRQTKMAADRDAMNMKDISTEEEAIQYQNLYSGESRVEELWAEDYADDDGGDMAGDEDQGGYEAAEVNERVTELELEEGDDWAALTEEEELARRVQSVLNEDLNQSSRTSYESICQKYIDNFNKGAHLFAKETHLSRRVADWTQRLEPILQQQEESVQFDIHAYCETFIVEVDDVVAQREAEMPEDAEQEAEQEVGFSAVVHGRSSAEVCRVFLACLQLTNQGTVSIIPTKRDQWNAELQMKESRRSSVGSYSSEGEKAVDPFNIRLLSNIHSRGMENFRAPSLQVPPNPLKSALKGKGKGKGKRVQMGSPMKGASAILSI
ncbi:hypothetical protein B484DRAFT_110063 [Ochromonadaceae sp. CCMP2298]|nr:hypothetical protein B484DRAFT_110063 [Ochromonadaceae sp. CCMP2298]